jgi:hypothetical protein
MVAEKNWASQVEAKNSVPYTLWALGADGVSSATGYLTRSRKTYGGRFSFGEGKARRKKEWCSKASYRGISKVKG